jgi:hypothetical protein
MRYRSGVSGATTVRLSGIGDGDETGAPFNTGASCSPKGSVAAVCAGKGTFRIVDTTSGFGSNRRRMSSTSLLLRPRASVRTARWFSP